MAYQLSVFVDNQPGKLDKLTGILGSNNVNVNSITIASAGEFGIVKIIVDDVEKGEQALKTANFAVSKKKIIMAVIQDRPGKLHEIISLLSSKQINIEDCYGYQLHGKNEAVIVMEIEKFPEAEKVLKEAGIRLLSDS